VCLNILSESPSVLPISFFGHVMLYSVQACRSEPSRIRSRFYQHEDGCSGTTRTTMFHSECCEVCVLCSECVAIMIA
jgi:hypothetical protein